MTQNGTIINDTSLVVAYDFENVDGNNVPDYSKNGINGEKFGAGT